MDKIPTPLFSHPHYVAGDIGRMPVPLDGRVMAPVAYSQVTFVEKLVLDLNAEIAVLKDQYIEERLERQMQSHKIENLERDAQDMFLMIQNEVQETREMVSKCEKDINELSKEIHSKLDMAVAMNRDQKDAISKQHTKEVEALKVATESAYKDMSTQIASQAAEQEKEACTLKSRIDECSGQIQINSTMTKQELDKNHQMISELKMSIMETRDEMNQVVNIIQMMKESITAIRSKAFQK